VTPTPPLLSEVSSIAVLRANAMGDYLVSEPALAALRAAAPQARITLLGGDFAVTALTGRPGPVDEVVLVPPVAGVREAAAGAKPDPQAFYTDMRARRFDVALQLHGGGRNSNPMVLSLGAAFTAGLQAYDAPPLDHNLAYQYWQHEVLRYLDVVESIGARTIRTQPRFTVLPGDLVASERALPSQGRPIVVLHPGATDPKRRWPATCFAEVADHLSAQGLRVCVIGTEEEVRPVVKSAKAAQPLTQLTFEALVGLLARARLLVGNDSGPRHLADAIGTPTVSIYWCGNMVSTAPVSRRTNRVHISWVTDCPVCTISLVGEPFPRRCCDTVSCVATVPVDVVLASIVELLDVRERPMTSSTDDAIRREAGAS
jgi:ADP-heptose:LPS heptosyltransferase